MGNDQRLTRGNDWHHNESMAITVRKKENQNAWNIAFSAFFVIVLAVCMAAVWRMYGGFPQGVSVFDAILMAFATFRVTRLIVYDKITRWFRELFVRKEMVEQDGEQWVQLEPYQNGFRGTVHDLLQCPWCIGFWSALAIAFMYFMFDWSWFLIFFLALAGAGSLLQLVANMVGWKAEYLKLQAREKEGRTDVDLTSIGK